MKRSFKQLEKGIYLIGKNVFFRQMLEGKRVMEKAPMQGALALDERGRPTKELKRAYQNWSFGRVNERWEMEHMEQRVPTFEELVEAYVKAATEERIKNEGKPTERTVANARTSFARLLESCGLKSTDKITKLDTQMLERYFVQAVKDGMKRVSAYTYMVSAKSLTCKWALPYYARMGMKVEKIELPNVKNRRGGRYERPSEETRRQVMAWYEKLWSLDDKRLWMGATLMLQFAMRNGDARAAKWSWFVKRKVEGGEQVYLRYTPEKTRNSSARHVMWPVHKDVWKRMQQARRSMEESELQMEKVSEEELERGEELGENVLPGGFGVFVQLNASLRAGVPGLRESEKACYELRKLRIDAEYRKNGAERASALSGDNINTITYYYADVADVEATPTKAEELIL